MLTNFLRSFMFQKWENLLLLHWRIPKNLLDSTIPKELSLDLHDGDAWISVVGFRLTNLKIKPMVQIPWKDFNELNLRTYVRDQSGREGVWFYSLDSTDLLAVLGARTLYGLNYRFASIEQTIESERIGYNSQTKFMQEPVAGEISAEFSKMNKSLTVAEPGGLDFFLLERYRFWSDRYFKNKLSHATVRHKPYEFFSIDNERAAYRGTLFRSHRIDEPVKKPDLVHYSQGFSVQASAPYWALGIAGQANHI